MIGAAVRAAVVTFADGRGRARPSCCHPAYIPQAARPALTTTQVWHAYTFPMTAMRDELHHLVDELPEAEVGPVLDLVRDHVASQPERRRRLSFAGLLHAESDLASRSEEILRAKFSNGSE